MLLVFDVGNTNICVALYDKNKILHKWRIVTESIRNSEDLNIILTELLNLEKIKFSQISEFILSSVVKKITNIISELSIKKSKKLLKLSDPSTKIDFQSVTGDNYRNIVGEDIICNVIAGKKKFKENFIIVDMGTAITFDVVGKNGFHIGEVIVPDINIAMETMVNKCCLLKKEDARLKYQDFVIGKTTSEAINGGIFWGYVGLIKNIIIKIERELNCKMEVCLTGGISNIFVHHLPFINNVDLDLTINGLIEIWKYNNTK